MEKKGNRVLNFKLAFLLSVKRLFPQELMAKNEKSFSHSNEIKNIMSDE